MKILVEFLRRRVFNTFQHSLQGFRAAWRSDEAIRAELALLPVLTVIAVVFAPGRVEAILLIGSALLVLMVELLNTALEKTVDRISTEQHHLSKSIKDIGSAAVLTAMVIFLAVWVGVFV